MLIEQRSLGSLRVEVSELDKRPTGELSSLRTETRVGFAEVSAEIASSQSATIKGFVATQVARILSMAGIVLAAVGLG